LVFALPAVQSAASEKKLNVYFINWAMYSDANQKQTVDQLPWDRISTINHAFWRIVPNPARTEFHIASTDAYADGLHFAEYERLTKEYPDVDVVLSVGGWTDTKWFAEMASTEAGRASFIASCVRTLNDNAFLGGIDLDWEYPGTARNYEGEGFIGSRADKDNFTALIKELRQAFDDAGLKDKIITFCASTNTASYKNGSICVDFAAVAPYVDRINIMTYDMAWSGSPNGTHHTALYPGKHVPSGASASEAAEYVISLGVKPEKINIGSPLYSQGWVIPSAVASGSDADIAAGALGGRVTKPGYGLIGAGQLRWFDLKSIESTEGWIKGYDDEAQAAYLYNNDPASKLYQQFYTYEDERSLDAKLAYINETGLGGLIVWDTPGDSANFAMLSRMAKGLGIYDGELPIYEPGPFSAP
jgi:chitinase